MRTLVYFAIAVFLLAAAGMASHFGLLSEFAKKTVLQQHRAVDFTDVYAHHGDFIHDVPFHAGESMFVHYKIHRLRTCIITIQFRLTEKRPGDKWTGLASFGYPMAAYYGPASFLETNELFEIPRAMPLGDYELRRQNFVDCDGEKWVELSPPAALTIVAP